MTPLFFVLFLLFDIQHPKTPADGIEKQFVTSQLVDQTLVDCTMNPQGGGALHSEPLTVNWVKSPDQHAVGSRSASPSNGPLHVVPLANTNDQRKWVLTSSGSSVCDGTASSPHSPCPPVAVTPEPSSFAILGITAATLLFLLFGQRLSHRFARRI